MPKDNETGTVEEVLRRLNLPVKTVVVLLALALATVLSVTVPIPGKPLLPPRHVTLVTGSGQTIPTSVAVMLVSTQDDPPALWRVVGGAESLWNDLAVNPGWGFDGRAGDVHQEEARANAWYVAQRELGYQVGLRITAGDPPSGLQRGDVILSVNSQEATSTYLTQSLRRMQAAARENTVTAQAASEKGLTFERGGRETVSAPTHTVLVQRGGQDLLITIEGAPLGSSVQAEEWTENPNPYTVPSLTGVTGASAGLALALSYLEGLTGARLAGEPVAVTGALWTRMDGGAGVGSIAGLPQKIEAAVGSGYRTLVVPLVQFDEAVAIAGQRPVTIIGVRTLEAAVGTLCERGGSCASLPVHLTSYRGGDVATRPAQG